MAGKLKILIFVLLILLTSTSFLNVKAEVGSSSQQIANGANLVWEKTYGGTGDDRAYDAIPTSDGFMVVGSSGSFIQQQTVGWAIRLDREGNVVWNQTYPENVSTEFRCALSLQDGFLLLGNMLSSSPNGYIVKIDNEGKMLWNVTVGVGSSAKLWSAVETEDGFVLAGFTLGAFGNVWIAKINVNGTEVWSKTFGGQTECAGRAITLSPDNGFVVAGFINDSSASADYDFLLCKFDAQGNIQWNKTYGGSESDKAYDILTASDGYLIAGDTRSKGAGDCDAWVLKVDWDGNLLWDKTVGGSNFDEATCISSSIRGGYIVGGWTISYGNGQRDFWLFKLDDSGNLLWNCTLGRSDYEEAYAVCQVSENEFVMAGWTESIGNGYYDFYVVDIKIENNSANWLQPEQLVILITFSLISLFVATILIRKFYKGQAKKQNENLT